ncbi:MAG TPA: hypothetical protein VFI11_14925 [Anaerolineales bacterium]|nr:hypothetical protein [Anaerolineales bacterium]
MTSEGGGESSRTPAERPASVTCLGCGGLILAAVFLVRLALSLSLPALPLTIPPAYLTITGAVWGGLGLLVGTGLLLGRRWAYRGVPLLAAALGAWYWADRLLLVQTDYAARSWPAAALASVLLLAVVVFLWTHPSARRYFRRPIDDESSPTA